MNKYLILFVLIFIISCNSESEHTYVEPYSFFVAGHTYGKPGTNTIGFHPPFKNEFDSIKSYPKMSFGILTGDIVQHSNEESWDAIDIDIEELGLPVFLVPGNHDIYDNDLFAQKYGDPEHNQRTYRYFLRNKELFVLLDANIDNWSISGDQLSFLQQALELHRGRVNSVFIFVHQLIWWDDDSVFDSVVTNWPPYTPDTTNFWGTIEPLLQDYASQVYLIAGDLGANKPAEPYLYYKKDNITYMAGGMGSGINDNYLIVSINEQGQVSFDLIALQGERNRFGKLEDYVLP